MPKGKAKPIVEDVPIWDALVAELGDPRPYEPGVIGNSYVVPDDAFFDLKLAVEADLSEVDRDSVDATDALDGWSELAREKLDELWPWPPRAVEWRNANEVTTQLPVVATSDAQS